MVDQTVQQQVIEEAQETFGGDVIVYVGQDSAGDHLVRINGQEVLYTIPNDWL
jgi:hypothetical protein